MVAERGLFSFQFSLVKLIAIVIFLSAVVLGIMFFTYGFGMREGYEAGFEKARIQTESYMARLPIEGVTATEDEMDSVATEVYDRLSLRKMIAPENVNTPDVNEVQDTADIKPETENSSKAIETTATEPKQESVVQNSSSTLRTPFKVIDDGSLPKGWFVQVAAPGSEKEATSLGKSLRDLGFPVAIEKANAQDRAYFRVLVGPENSRKSAEILISQLRRESLVTQSPFLRLVK